MADKSNKIIYKFFLKKNLIVWHSPLPLAHRRPGSENELRHSAACTRHSSTRTWHRRPPQLRQLIKKGQSFKGTVSRDAYEYGILLRRPNYFHQYFLCMRWWFSRSFNSFSLHYLYFLLWSYFLILKMLTETLLRIPFYVIGRCSQVPTGIIGCRKNEHELTYQRRLPVWFNGTTGGFM
jgi:hypothetical protein